MAPRIFRKTAGQMARQKLLNIFIALICGGFFVSAFFLADSDKLTGLVIAGLSFAILIIAFILFGNLKDLAQILSDGQDWTVEVSDEKLSWNSPLQNQMKSFEAKFCDIASVEFKKIRFRNNGSRTAKRYKQYFHIHFRNGSSLKIDPFRSGINPFKVFEELERRGVRFEQLEEWKGSRKVIHSSY